MQKHLNRIAVAAISSLILSSANLVSAEIARDNPLRAFWGSVPEPFYPTLFVGSEAKTPPPPAKAAALTVPTARIVDFPGPRRPVRPGADMALAA